MTTPEESNPLRELTAQLLYAELEFTTARSGGPGGQNVNKVNTKVILKFSIDKSAILSDEEKSILRQKLASKVTTDGVFVISAQEERSQLDNKERVIEKFDRLLKKAFEKKKPRKKTKPSKAAKEKRMNEKKKLSEKKQLRKNSGY